jgi:hypothetical protein
VSGGTAGAVIGALGLTALLLAHDRRIRIGGLAAWAAGAALLAGALGSAAIAAARVSLWAHPLRGAAVLAAAAAGLVAGLWAVRRWPWAFPVAAVAAAPARVPVSLGGQEASLLVPLYVVIAVGAVATAWDMLDGRDRRPDVGWIALPLAGFLVLAAASVAWSADRRHGWVTMLFFLLPFGFLLVRLAGARPVRAWLVPALAVQCALAAVFAGVALWQEATREVWWNPRVIVANEYVDYFRVNSLFWDPSVYARFMVVTLVILAGVVVFRGASVPLLAFVALTFIAVYFSYSQSALLALATGVVVLGTALWPPRVTLALVAVAAIAGTILLAATLADDSAKRVTSDRSRLVELGWKVTREHPIAGAGLGGFQRAAQRDTAHPWRLRRAASHTTPVTVVAELGPVGFALYAALLLAIAVTAMRSRRPVGPRWTALAALAAIFVSSCFYNAFFEDPHLWMLTALIALTALPDPAREAPA